MREISPGSGTMRAMRLVWTLLGARGLPEASRSKLGVVGLLYFIEGSPVSVLWEVLPVYLRIHGTSLRAIGGLRLLELPFSLKFLWSPLVQRFGDRRAWVTGAMLVVALVVALMPLVDPARGLTVLFVLILVLTIAAATQDMAIDAYTVALVRREEQGAANGVRASAYRVALVLIGSGMVALAHFLPWGVLFAAVAVVFAGLGLLVQRVPRLDVPAEARQRWLRPFLALDRHLAGRPARPVRPHLQAGRVRDRADGQALLGGPRGLAARDRPGPDGARHRALDRRRPRGRRLHAALRHPHRPVGARAPAGDLEPGLRGRRLVEPPAARALCRFDDRLVRGRAGDRGVPRLLPGRLRSASAPPSSTRSCRPSSRSPAGSRAR